MTHDGRWNSRTSNVTEPLIYRYKYLVPGMISHISHIFTHLVRTVRAKQPPTSSYFVLVAMYGIVVGQGTKTTETLVNEFYLTGTTKEASCLLSVNSSFYSCFLIKFFFVDCRFYRLLPLPCSGKNHDDVVLGQS